MTKLTTTYCLICALLSTTCFNSFSQFQIADSIFSKGNYTLASLEYERIISKHKDDSIFAIAIIKKAECHKRNHQYSDALRVLDEITPYYYNDTINYLAKHEIILCSLLDNQAEYAIKQCSQLRTIVQDTNLHHKILYLEILAYNDLYNWEDALVVLKKYLKYKKININADSLYEPILNHKFLDPLKAKRMSYYFPGLGQAYTNTYRDATASMLLQSVIITFTAYSVLHGFYVSSLFTGISNLRTFYMGGSVHAYFLAEEKNQRVRETFNKKVKSLILNYETQIQ